MDTDLIKHKIFKRRVFALGGFKVATLCILIGRLYNLQILNNEEFSDLADNNKTRTQLILPPRGIIYDRNKQPLVTNEDYYRIILNADNAKHIDPIINNLASVLSLNEETVKKITKLTKEEYRNKWQSLVLYKHLSRDQLIKTEFNLPDMPGISIDVGMVRRYVLAHGAAHITGYLGAPTKREIANENEVGLARYPDYKIGKSGIEKTMEPTLRGNAGVKKVEVNAMGIKVKEKIIQSANIGNNITLSIDKRIQSFIMERLKDVTASVALIDVKSGNIVAIHSSPGFDPNEFSRGISSDIWNKLAQDEKKPLINKAIARPYPPGSTFKIISALTALSNGFNPNTPIFCDGSYRFGNRIFHCWKEEGHGRVESIEKAIMLSCNVYFYKLATTLEIDDINKMAKRFGLGSKFNIELDEQNEGIVPSRKWKKTKFKQAWAGGETLNTAIGQGYLEVTPLQLAVMISRIASNGKQVNPSLILHEDGDKNDKSWHDLGIKQEHLDIVKNGLFRVVNEPGGTAYWHRIVENGMTMAGKSGTAQVISRRLSKEELASGNVLDIYKNHGLFVGFAPFDSPKFAISVVVEHGGGGSVSAAPIAKDVLLYAQRVYNTAVDGVVLKNI